MRRFRYLFSALFIVATLLSALHEVIHTHDIKSPVDQNCPLYLLSQTPALTADGVSLARVAFFFEAFAEPDTGRTVLSAIASRNRSPPLS